MNNPHTEYICFLQEVEKKNVLPLRYHSSLYGNRKMSKNKRLNSIKPITENTERRL